MSRCQRMTTIVYRYALNIDGSEYVRSFLFHPETPFLGGHFQHRQSMERREENDLHHNPILPSTPRAESLSQTEFRPLGYRRMMHCCTGEERRGRRSKSIERTASCRRSGTDVLTLRHEVGSRIYKEMSSRDPSRMKIY